VIPRGSRWALCCLALLLFLSLYLRNATTQKGRLSAQTGGEAAFLPAPAGLVTVRLAGDFPRPGLYRFPAGSSAASAIKMTLPAARPAAASAALLAAPLCSGEVLTLSRRAGKSDYFSRGKMAAKERMLLGIPLHPDLLDARDWASLPGIGPVLSERIVADRQENGAFGTLAGLLRVPGLGPAKLAAISRYF